MDLRWLYAFVVSISLTSANHDSTIEAFYDYTDDYKETKPPSRSNTRTESPLSRYQVTEDIEDIPYPNPPPLPLATNFTVAKPLNIAGGNNSNNIKQDHIVNRDNPKFIKDFSTLPFDFDNDEEVKVSSINKHPNDADLELDEEFKDTDDDDEHHDHFPDFWPILRTYLYGLEKGIIKGLNGLVSKDVFKRSQVNEPNRNKMTPVWFLNKLKHRKGHSHDNMHGHFDHEYDDY